MLLRGDRTRRSQSPVVRVWSRHLSRRPGGAARFEARAAQRSATSRVPKALPNADHLLSLVGGFCHEFEKSAEISYFSPRRGESRRSREGGIPSGFEAMGSHPLVVEYLREVSAARVRNDHHDEATRLLACHLYRRLDRHAAGPTDE